MSNSFLVQYSAAMKIVEEKQSTEDASTSTALEIDLCNVVHDEKEDNDEENDSVNKSHPVKTSFERYLIVELRSINKKLDSMSQHINRIENHFLGVVYEMVSERRVTQSLHSVGMTSIRGLSSEFYHRWIYYNRYIDISLHPQSIEINLMGKSLRTCSFQRTFGKNAKKK